MHKKLIKIAISEMLELIKLDLQKLGVKHDVLLQSKVCMITAR